MLKRLLHYVLSVAMVVSVFSGIFASSVSAAGETFTWKDYNTILVSGGDLKSGTYEYKLQANSNPQKFSDSTVPTLMHESGCQIGFTITLTSDTSGTLSAPLPEEPSGPSYDDGNPNCDDIKYKEECSGIWPFRDCEFVPDGPAYPGVAEGYNGRTITIGGTRPNDQNQSETEQQKEVHIKVNSPKVNSQSPPSIQMTVTGPNGYNKTFTAEDEPEEGSDDPNSDLYVDPDFQSVYYYATVVLEPGEYEVCWTEVIPQCKTFTKVKFEELFLEYGELSATKQIEVKVEVHTTRPCGSDLRRSPETVTLRELPDGAPQEKQTEEFTSTPSAAEEGAICTVNVIMTRSVTFMDIEPGQYEVCTPIGGCVTYTKVEGEKGEVTIVISSEFAVPEEEPVCNTGTGFASFLAFVICPFTALITDATEFIEKNLIIPYLTVSPLQVGSPVHTIWEAVRNLANVAFIIAFLIIVFSQATSIGIGNYGIKRMLPRLVAVAVGANLSFFIVAFAIDAFNVLGAGVASLVLAALPDAAPGMGQDPNAASGTVAGLVGFGAVVIAAALTSAGAVLGWLWSLIVAAFMVVILAVIVLVLRQMLIIVLVILSPLAFVAWLLPNTERYFTKWRQLLIQLLLMYPMIVLLFAVGKIFTAIVNAGEFQLTTGGASEQVAESIKVLLGFVAAILPLAALPLTFMVAGTMMSNIYSRAQKLGARGREAASAAAGRTIKPFAQKHAGGAKLAQSSNPFVRRMGWLAMQKQRREFAASQRERELKKAQGEYIADQAAGSEGFRKSAAGIGGETGQQRILAEALASQERTGREELENATALYNHVLRRVGVDSKTFSDQHLKEFLQNGTDEVRDRNNQVAFRFSENPQLMEAMLDAAARAGEATTLQEAKLSQQLGSSDQQKMVDEVIRRNDGPLKSGSGYYLATHLDDLGIGRTRDASGNLVTDPDALRLRMDQTRLKTMAGQGADSIARYEWSGHEAIKDMLDGPNSTAIINSLSANERAQLKQRLTDALGNLNTASKIDNVPAVQKILSKL